jgi:choloylglycine hydrolase
MIRKFAVCTLAAAFALAPTAPAFACTNIVLKAKDGAVVRARTNEFAIPAESNIVLIPKGTELSGTLPDGGKGLDFTARYNMAGANAYGQNVIIDGMNDQGLTFGMLLFPDFAEYAEATPDNARRAMAPYEFGNWVLGNFATVDEVKKAVEDVVLVPTSTPVLDQVLPLHYAITDKTGKSIVIEPVGGKLKVYDNPLGVLTNAPGFDWHMTNLRNYVNLSVTGVPPIELDGVKFAQLGQGEGMHGLPGDFTPPSRFIRAVVFAHAEYPADTAEETVLSGFHIMNQFDIPHGSVRDTSGGKTQAEYTQWTTASDSQNMRFYFKTYGNQNIHLIDLGKAFAAADGEIRVVKMGTEQPIEDLSTDFMGGKQAAGAGQ